MGNICRSPMAEGLLRQQLVERDVEALIHSAGRLESGRAAAKHGVDVLADRGIDVGSHRSKTNSASLLEPAGLVLAMAREHVRDAVALAPAVWPRVFTLKELVRRGEEVGPRREDESLSAWLATCHEGRNRRDLLGQSSDDDIDDPYGQSRKAFEQLADELDLLIQRLVALLWPFPPVGLH